MNSTKKWHRVSNAVLALLICSVYGIAAYITSQEEIPSGIDPELKPYVVAFELEGKKYLGPTFHVPDMDIGFSRTRHLPTHDGGTIIGMCDPYIPKRTVVFDRDMWPLHSAIEKEELVFHELGHCVLDRDHLTTKVKNWPISIMYPYDSIMTYNYYRDQYLKELFTKDATDITATLSK